MTFKRAKQDKFSSTNYILTQFFYQQPRLFKVTQLSNDYVPFIFVLMVICLVLLSSFRRLKPTDTFRANIQHAMFPNQLEIEESMSYATHL